MKTFTQEIPVEAFRTEVISYLSETEPTVCLMISDFEKEENRENAESEVIKYFFRENLNSAINNVIPVITKTEIYTFSKKRKFFQLQIDLGIFEAKFFADRANEANVVMEIGQKHKGQNHHYHIFD